MSEMKYFYRYVYPQGHKSAWSMWSGETGLLRALKKGGHVVTIFLVGCEKIAVLDEGKIERRVSA